MNIGLATCKNPGSPHVSDEQVLVDALTARGVEVASLDWADPGGPKLEPPGPGGVDEAAGGGSGSPPADGAGDA